MQYLVYLSVVLSAACFLFGHVHLYLLDHEGVSPESDAALVWTFATVTASVSLLVIAFLGRLCGWM